ncbi:MAG: family hydrolase [Frankiales bacterium]|nr:family hydrolase [Frankiales bacterium]
MTRAAERSQGWPGVAAEGPRGAGLGSCSVPLMTAYDAGLYDLDGVLYVGQEAVPHAADSVRRATAAGLRAAFVTNNASRSPASVAEHLNRLDIPAQPSDVVTSGQAAARWLADHLAPGAPVLVLGTADLAAEVAAVGLRIVVSADEAPAAVVQGLAPSTGWNELAEAAVALGQGALWVAGNTDATLPSPRGPLPGNGAFVAALITATGRHPVVVGKPEPALHRESVERVAARHPLVIGDRLDTDVLGAVRGACDSLLVLTGVSDLEGLLAAPIGSRPTYVGTDLRALVMPQPAVRIVGENGRRERQVTAECDGVVARWAAQTLSVRQPGGPDVTVAQLDGARIRLTAPGLSGAPFVPAGAPGGVSCGADEADGGGREVAWSVAALRSLCVLAWQRADEGIESG